ncbi:MAG: hypothetical protein NZ821_08845 [Gloeomargarita sp. SKYB31]|nr:hypothetical protein [Gloeomargarita sp. SKYB31]
MGTKFLSPPEIPLLLSTPVSPDIGEMYYDITLGVLRVWDGANWITIGPLNPANPWAASALPGIPIPYTPVVPGTTDWVVPYAVGATAPTTLAWGAAGRTYWVPFVVTRAVRITDVAINVTTGATGVAVIYIYSANADGYPSSRLFASNNLDTGTTGVKSQGSLAVDLSPGVYWMAMHASGTPTVRALAVGSLRSLSLPNLGSAFNTAYFTPSIPGDPAPSSGYSGHTGAVPAVGVRYALL